ncbi:metalloregulator ArsR/SmtB family transcription factor [Paraglaciecola aquimarina]|uniref:Metalloregulator ArsR/SmtB family transcription factor n=1 Tax=Paraglaciecola aquimarina TaxID=1235557 RepID=A0ABU3SVT8_9ALTE|nr:metalloregulator ArsR/SmtB family transcription factor [Paraglaciecola aquimarina]MDU0354109.1 metalloregulator ArsR/SmtB family transcription factor [Paraglaciecola aquimarina]
MSPVTFYKCLSEDTRLQCLLLITLNKELCVCDLTAALQLSQPKVSRHLAELRKCGLLHDERRGKWVYYRLESNLPQWALEVLVKTAEQNPEYLACSLANLNQTLSNDSCC